MNILVLLILLGICSVTLSQEEVKKEKKKKNRYYGCAIGERSCLKIYTKRSFAAAKEKMQKMNINLYEDKEECNKACKKETS